MKSLKFQKPLTHSSVSFLRHVQSYKPRPTFSQPYRCEYRDQEDRPRLVERKALDGSMDANEEATTTKVWNLPEFIPGIVVRDNEWHLVITTPKGEKTVFWQKNLGDTLSLKGVYSFNI